MFRATFVLIGLLQADSTCRSGLARIGPARGRRQDLAGAGLQDPVFGERARARYRLFGDLHPEPVPDRNRSGPGDPQSRGSHDAGLRDDRSQSGVCGTPAGRSRRQERPTKRCTSQRSRKAPLRPPIRAPIRHFPIPAPRFPPDRPRPPADRLRGSSAEKLYAGGIVHRLWPAKLAVPITALSVVTRPVE